MKLGYSGKCADDMQMACRWHVCADDMWMMCRQHVCLRMMCGQCVDDTRCSTPWNWATQASVWMTCGRCADDICHPPVKSHPKYHSHVIHTSSACHLHVIRTSSARCLHVVHMRLQPQIYFHLKSRDSSAKNCRIVNRGRRALYFACDKGNCN